MFLTNMRLVLKLEHLMPILFIHVLICFYSCDISSGLRGDIVTFGQQIE